VVALLEADSIAVVVPDGTPLDHGPVTAIQEDSPAAAAIQRDVLLLVPLNRQVLYPRALYVIAANDGEHSRRPRAVRHHAIGVQRDTDGKGITVAARDTGDRGIEATGVLVPDRDAVSDSESRGILDGDLFLAIVAIDL